MAQAREIIVVGLGPGRWEDLTLEARDILSAASQIICRTVRHPTVDALRSYRPDLRIDSFDALYETADSFAQLYPRMVAQLLERAALPDDAPVIYAVPGHPLIAEESVRQLRLRAQEHGVTVRIVAGLSFLEPVCAALDIDPLERDLQLVDATLLADLPPPALMGALLPTRPALIAQVYNRRLMSGVKLALGELYPDDWQAFIVRSASIPGAEVVERTPLLELDRGDRADHLTSIYIPPLTPLANIRAPEGLRYITARLRAPDGCPWDREQTHQSLRKYVLEEAYEVADVLDEWDGSPEVAEHLAEELGDLLLQVYLHAEIADQEDLFHIGDVYQAVSEKLIRRHPHVFGAVAVDGAAQVVRNWETIKRGERAARGEQPDTESALRGVPQSAPALTQAFELGKKAARIGFDWPTTDDALAKIAEEAREIAAAPDAAQQAAELGDLLFALVTLARRLTIQPEDALRAANGRFRRRFEVMEAELRATGQTPQALTTAQWLALWQTAKATLA